MKQKGTITIFLCLVLVSISAMICGLVESARIAGVRFYLQLSADSAIDSLFSEYDNKLWEEYRLISSVLEDDDKIKEGLGKYVKPYVEESGIYRINAPEFEILDRQMLTDEGGAWLEEEAYDYMKYKVVSDLLMDSDPSDVWKQIKEAQSMNKITSNYGLQSKRAIKLEKTLMRIGEYVKTQKQNRQNAMDELHSRSFSTFVASAGILNHKCDEIGTLVSKYSHQADELEEELARAELENRKEWAELSEENQKILEEQIGEFKPYVEKNGERRVQVEALSEEAKQTKNISQESIALAEYIMQRKEEEENSKEDTDGDGEIDFYVEYVEYEEDVSRLEELFESVQISDIGFQYGVEDENAADILSSLQEVLQNGFLGFVIPPDREIKNGYMDISILPSHTDRTERSVEAAGLIKNILVNEYAVGHFPCFTDNVEDAFAYELEYVIEGKQKASTNLSLVVGELVAIRCGLNYLHIMTDTEKLSKVTILANTIALAGGIPFLNALVKFLIITVWAMAEAILDVKDLLAGKEVSLIKTAKNWHLSVDGILDIGRDNSLLQNGDFQTKKQREEESSSFAGEKRLKMDYKFYLRLLLFVQNQEDRNYRMMDLIQFHLNKINPGFQVKNCMYSLRTKVNLEFETVFSQLGLVKSELSGIGASYKISTEAVKAY